MAATTTTTRGSEAEEEKVSRFSLVNLRKYKTIAATYYSGNLHKIVHPLIYSLTHSLKMHFKGSPHVIANFSVAIASTTVGKKRKDKKVNRIAASMNLFKSFCLELDKLCRSYRRTTTRTRSSHFFSAANCGSSDSVTVAIIVAGAA